MTKIFHPPKRSAAATLFLPGERAQANASADKEVFSDRPRPCTPPANNDFKVMSFAEKVHATELTRKSIKFSPGKAHFACFNCYPGDSSQVPPEAGGRWSGRETLFQMLFL